MLHQFVCTANDGSEIPSCQSRAPCRCAVSLQHKGISLQRPRRERRHHKGRVCGLSASRISQSRRPKGKAARNHQFLALALALTAKLALPPPRYAWDNCVLSRYSWWRWHLLGLTPAVLLWRGWLQPVTGGALYQHQAPCITPPHRGDSGCAHRRAWSCGVEW